MKIREVSHADVWARFHGPAERAGVYLGNDRAGKSRWFMVDDVACAGMLEVRPGVWRLKGLYVDPAFRGMGIAQALTEHRTDVALAAGAAQLESYVRRPHTYEARGWTAADKSPHPGTYLVRLRAEDRVRILSEPLPGGES